MPDVLFIMTKAASENMTDHVFDVLSQKVASAVAVTLGLKGPEEVVTYELVANRSRNANPIQVMCIASATEERLAKITVLRDNISVALQGAQEHTGCAAYFKLVGTAESWPIMPNGSWGEVALTRKRGT